MKRILAFLLTLSLVLGMLVSCGSQTLAETATKETAEEKKTEEKKTEEKKTEEEKMTEVKTTEEATETATEEVLTDETQIDHMLDGARIIFVGNSYTYYGNAVVVKNVSVRDQLSRSNDRGYFYQICKSKGAEVSVTNWTYGSHGLADLFDTCGANRGCDGRKHKNDLKEAEFDYVFLQERTGAEITQEKFLENVDRAMAFFRAANPDVKFFFLVQHKVYDENIQWLPAVKQLPAKGVTVVEWGAMVSDIINGATAVPGATETYNKNSFIVNQSADDGYHPNMLTGYITAQMAYCAITGESAVGGDYSFCLDANVNSAFNPATFITKYYKYQGATTNLRAIFASPADMTGLQTLMDRYKTEYRYNKY